MKRVALDIYDDMPRNMKRYISNYGWHFSKKACEYACSLMKKRINNVPSKVAPYTKEMVDTLLSNNGVSLTNKFLYDYVFVANMCKADYLGSSIIDERHLALYVKDTVDDIDASEETTFRRWVATMVGNGEPIEWEDML